MPVLFEGQVKAVVELLGDKESHKFTPHEQDYEPFDADQKLCRRVT